MVKLNLGCGQNMVKGYVNIDRYDTFSPDLVWNLEQTPWPFKDGEVEEILATHVLEHLAQATDTFLAIIQEMYRVMAPGAMLRIKVPHHRSDGFWGDPTHVRAISVNMLTLFSKTNCRMFKERGWPNTPLADYLGVDFEVTDVSYALTPYWAAKAKDGASDEMQFAIETYNNVIDEVSVNLRRV